jgi:PAS domain S-box-containing protein
MKVLRAVDALSDRLLQVEADARLSDVWDEIERRSATHVAVRDGSRHCGVIRLQDLLVLSRGRIFADLISAQTPLQIPPNLPVDDINRLFVERNLDGAAVIDAAGRFVGIVTQQSLLNALLAERHTIEYELRQNQRFIEQVTDTAPHILYVHDVIEDCNLYTNSRIQTVLGCSSEEVLALGTNVVPYMLHPDDIDAFYRSMSSSARAADDEIVEGAWRLRHCDGTWRWMQTRQVVFEREPNGTVRSVIGAADDVTDRREAEEQIRHLHVSLAHASRLSVMGEMAAGVAHELHQPLAVIANYANGGLVRQEKGTFDGISAVESLESIARETLRAGNILRSIRRFLQKREPERQLVNLNAVALDALQLASVGLKPSQAHIELQLADDLPLVHGDPTQLTQAVLNLVLNAADAMSEADSPTRRIILRSSQIPQNEVELTVSDTGPGITADIGDRVFDQFYTTKAQGLGMGLGISRSILERHGGRLLLDRPGASGAVFRLQLPQTPPGDGACCVSAEDADPVPRVADSVP